MRHQVAGKKLNRDKQHRQALFRNLAREMILHGSIETTEAKAKAMQPIMDKLLTKAKGGTLSQRRQLFKFLVKRDLVNQLVDRIAPETNKRTSGFTRIVKLGRRRGDATMVVRLEFVDTIQPAAPKQKEEKAAPKPATTKSKATKKVDTKPAAKKTTKKAVAKPATKKAKE